MHKKKIFVDKMIENKNDNKNQYNIGWMYWL